MSYARRLKVGAVVVKDVNIISIGWNGTPSGQDNNCEFDNEDGTLITKPDVLHAEYNSVKKLKNLNEDGKLSGATFYCTLSPCINCAHLIFETHIKRVVYRDTYRDTSGIGYLRSMGIQVDKLENIINPQKIDTRAFSHEFMAMKTALEKIARIQMLKSEIIALACSTLKDLRED